MCLQNGRRGNCTKYVPTYTADPVAMLQKVVPVHYTGISSVLARLSVHTDRISCLYFGAISSSSTLRSHLYRYNNSFINGFYGFLAGTLPASVGSDLFSLALSICLNFLFC